MVSPSWRVAGPWAGGLQRPRPKCNTIPYHAISWYACAEPDCPYNGRACLEVAADACCASFDTGTTLYYIVMIWCLGRPWWAHASVMPIRTARGCLHFRPTARFYESETSQARTEGAHTRPQGCAALCAGAPNCQSPCMQTCKHANMHDVLAGALGYRGAV
jgi:hypothetical protein